MIHIHSGEKNASRSNRYFVYFSEHLLKDPNDVQAILHGTLSI